jgi:dUTP pyrophosphatase
MLNKQEINQLIDQAKLIENYIDRETQLTPNGFDLTVETVHQFITGGSLDFSNQERVLPQVKELKSQKKSAQETHGWWAMPHGVYKIKTNETVNIPNNLTAAAFTRTSLLRMGAFTVNGLWDAGFSGKSEFILVVENPYGINLKQNARIIQLVFFPVSETESYNGIYKGLK